MILYLLRAYRLHRLRGVGLGQTLANHWNPIIRTHVKIGAEQLNEAQREHIFVRELLHACCQVVGFEDEPYPEEQFLTRLAPILHTVLRENGFWPTGKDDA
jgi:hypothetical protein